MSMVCYFMRSQFCKMLFLLRKMVLQERIELSTSPLPRECSTTELLQRRCGLANAFACVAGD